VIPKSKLNTARAVVFKKYKVPYCYTIEGSYGLADNDVRLTNEDFVEVGRHIAIATG
jgi:hypothetical protein